MQKSTRNLEIRVGLVFIVAVAALVGGILWGKRIGLAATQKQVTFIFPNAAGVKPGTPVNLNGVERGIVTDVKPVDEGAEVTAFLDRDVPLRKDARAAIQMLEITGGKRIELYPGTSSEQLAGGDAIEGVNQGDIGALVAVMGGIADQIRPTLLRVDTAIAAITAIIGDPAFQRNASTAVESFADVGVDLRRVLRSNEGRINRTLASLENLSTDLNSFIDNNRDELERIISNGDIAVGDLRRTLGNADRSLENVDGLVDSLDVILAEIRTGDGTVSRLLYDKEFADDLEGTLQALRDLLVLFRDYGVNVNMEVGHEYPKKK